MLDTCVGIWALEHQGSIIWATKYNKEGRQKSYHLILKDGKDDVILGPAAKQYNLGFTDSNALVGRDSISSREFFSIDWPVHLLEPNGTIKIQLYPSGNYTIEDDV